MSLNSKVAPRESASTSRNMAAFRTPPFGKNGTNATTSNVVSSPLNQSKELNLQSVPIIKDSVFNAKPNQKPATSFDTRIFPEKESSQNPTPCVFVTPPQSPNISFSKRKNMSSKMETTAKNKEVSPINDKCNTLLENDSLQTRSKSLDHHTNDSLDLNNVEVIDDVSINRWLMRIMRLGASYTSTGSNGYNNAGTATNTTTASPSSSPSSYSSSYLSPPAFGTPGSSMSSSYLHHSGRRRMSLNVMDQNHLSLSRLPTATGWRARRLSESSNISSCLGLGPGIPIPTTNHGSLGYMSSPACTTRANRLRRGIILSIKISWRVYQSRNLF